MTWGLFLGKSAVERRGFQGHTMFCSWPQIGMRTALQSSSHSGRNQHTRRSWERETEAFWLLLVIVILWPSTPILCSCFWGSYMKSSTGRHQQIEELAQAINTQQCHVAQVTCLHFQRRRLVICFWDCITIWMLWWRRWKETMPWLWSRSFTRWGVTNLFSTWI